MAGRTLTPPAGLVHRAPLTLGERRAAVRERIGAADLHALIVLDLADIRYLSGFTGSTGVLVLLADGTDAFFTDFRYQTQVAEELDAAIDVRIENEGLLKMSREFLAGRGISRVGFEREQLTYRAWAEWSERQAPALVPVEEWIEELRMRKTAPEIAAIREACRIADETFERILEEVRPGITERELAARLDLELAARGAGGPSFETIVAFGERAALPHARPGQRELRRGDVVLFDFGAVAEGYVSDISRTIAFGEPAAEMRAVYALVLEAQAAAIGGIRAGMKGPEADRLAREVIEAAGHGPDFGHSLGHGIGLEVHEAPRLGRKSEDTLDTGMTVTIEPGVYLEGTGGVRIEDDALVTDAGVELLTSAPKDQLIVL
ncbi:MAG TPA: Xaa-Pro peptidase family protein [Gemmatimonadota bacterium]|nr:Xaa-Pro peptidase family protein [Gemmatimonadota bacterium]